MTDVTVKTLAAEIQTSVDRPVQQFADAGIPKSADDSVSAQEKQTLLAHLNRENGSAPDKLTLQRKTRSTLNIPVPVEKQIGTNRSPQDTHLCETRSAEAERLAAEEQAQREAEEQARREAEEAAKREAQQSRT